MDLKIHNGLISPVTTQPRKTAAYSEALEKLNNLELRHLSPEGSDADDIQVTKQKIGDTIFFYNQAKVSVGDRLGSYMVKDVVFEPKPKWKFWQRKKQIGFLIEKVE